MNPAYRHYPATGIKETLFSGINGNRKACEPVRFSKRRAEKQGAVKGELIHYRPDKIQFPNPSHHTKPELVRYRLAAFSYLCTYFRF